MDAVFDAIAKLIANPSSWVAALGVVAALFSARRASQSAVEAKESAELAARALRTNANQYAAQLVIESSRIAVEYPEIAPYLNNERSISAEPDPKVKLRARAAVEAQLDVMEAIWDHHSEFADDDVEAWREWMHHVLKNELHKEAYEPDWYPSIRVMLAESGCSGSIQEHAWAVQTGAADGAERLKHARDELESARGKLAAKGDKRAAARLLRDFAETHFRVVQSRQHAFVDGLKRTTDKSSDAAEQTLTEYRQHEAKFAAAAERRSKTRGWFGRGARLRVAALRNWLVTKVLEPAPPPTPRQLGDLMNGLTYWKQVREGRKMRLQDAITAALRDLTVTDESATATLTDAAAALQAPPEHEASPVLEPSTLA